MKIFFFIVVEQQLLCTLQINNTHSVRDITKVRAFGIGILQYYFSHFLLLLLLTASNNHFMYMASEMGFLKVLSSFFTCCYFFLCEKFSNEFYCRFIFNPEMENIKNSLWVWKIWKVIQRLSGKDSDERAVLRIKRWICSQVFFHAEWILHFCPNRCHK